jgi:hypothetical protein
VVNVRVQGSPETDVSWRRPLRDAVRRDARLDCARQTALRSDATEAVRQTLNGTAARYPISTTATLAADISLSRCSTNTSLRGDHSEVAGLRHLPAQNSAPFASGQGIDDVRDGTGRPALSL